MLAVAFAAVLSAQGVNTGLILGRVLDAGSGAPVDAALVDLALINDAPTSQTVLTGPDGQFVFGNLPAGRFRLRAHKPGYSDGPYGGRRPEDYRSEPIPLAAGERRSAITLRVWKFGAITGRVVDEAGEPLVYVYVAAYARRNVAGRTVLGSPTRAFTDDRGQYRLARLVAGDYLIAADLQQSSAPASVVDEIDQLQREGKRDRWQPMTMALMGMNAPSSPAHGGSFRLGDSIVSLGALPTNRRDGRLVYPTTFYPNAALPQAATPVRVESGEERGGIDLSLAPARAVSVFGTVTGPSGPVALIPIQLVPEGSLPYMWGRSAAAALTATDRLGRFTFPSVIPGRYTLHSLRGPGGGFGFSGISSQTSAAGTTLSVTEVEMSTPPTQPTLAGSLSIDVGDRDVRDVAMTLRGGVRVSGRLEFAGTSARPSAPALQRNHVVLDRIDGLSDGTLFEPTGSINAQGEFATVEIPPGRYTVRFSIPYEGWTIESATWAGRDVSDVPLEVGERPITGLVIRLTDRPSRLAGTVRNGLQPAGDEHVVLLFPTDRTRWVDNGEDPRSLKAAPVTAAGTYAVDGLPVGEYFAVAVRDDFLSDWRAPDNLERLSRVATRLRLEVSSDRRALDLSVSSVRR
jgi:hypothetical protein